MFSIIYCESGCSGQEECNCNHGTIDFRSIRFMINDSRIEQFTQTQMQYSDGKNGRCDIGVIMSYFGWNGTDDFDTAKVLFVEMGKLKSAGIGEDLLINL